MNWLKIGPYIAIALLVMVVGLQRASNQLVSSKLETSEAALKLSREGREQDRKTYAAAQATALQMERDRAAALVRQAKEISHASDARNQSRLAALDALIGGLRLDAKGSAAAGSAAGSVPAGAVPGAAAGADGAAGVAYAACDRDCLAALIRYDELISWVEAQQAVTAPAD